MPEAAGAGGALPTTGGGVFPQEPKLYLANTATLVLLEIVALRPLQAGEATVPAPQPAEKPPGNVVGKPLTVAWPGNVVPILTASLSQEPMISHERMPGPKCLMSLPIWPATAPLLGL